MRCGIYLQVLGAAVLAVSLGGSATAQDTQAKDAQGQLKGVPPRAAAADYQAQTKVGAFTLAAEFAAHGVPTPEAIYSNDDYVSVEVGLYGPADMPLKVSQSEFSLRINGKPVAVEAVARTFSSLKDPEWVPPGGLPEKGSKGGLSTGGGGQNDPPPTPPKMPFELRRTMQQRVTKAELPEGDRALPVAGLLFFSFRGKAENIRSVELAYDGAAGKAVLPLHP